MKTNLKSLVVAILMCAAPMFVVAQQNNETASLKTGIYFSKDGKLNVFVENFSKKSANVQVKDANDQIVFQKRTGYTSSLTALKFDMDALPDGEYTIEVANDKDKITQVVSLETPKKERTLVAVQKAEPQP